MKYLLIFIYLFLAIILMVFETLKIKRKEKISFSNFFTFIFSIFYGIAPAGIYLSNVLNYKHKWKEVGNRIISYDFIILSIIIILFSSIKMGWYVGGKFTIFKTNKMSKHSKYKLIKKLNFLAWFFLGIAVVLIYIHTKPYGGFINSLTFASAIRSGNIEVQNPWSFLRPFGKFGVYSSYLFFSIIWSYKKYNQNTFVVKIGFFLSFLFSMYYLVSLGGRLTIAFYLFSIILSYYLIKYKRIKILKLGFGLITVIVTLYFGYSFIYNVRRLLLGGEIIEFNSDLSIFKFFLNEISFPFYSILNSIDKVFIQAFNLRYFVDFPLAFIHIMPSSIIEPSIENISAVNTMLMPYKTGGTVPVDLISLGIYSFGILGPPILGFIYGLINRLLEKYIIRLPLKSLRKIIFVVIGLALARSLVYADPLFVLKGNFCLIIGFFITNFKIQC